MKVILISRTLGASRSLELGRWSRAILSLCCIGLPLSLLSAGYMAGQDSEAQNAHSAALDALQDELDAQADELDALKHRAADELRAMTLHVAELQARMTRVDALGEHLTVMADLAPGEFDFSQTPAMGGPLSPDYNVDFTQSDMTGELSELDARIRDREQQLEVLESLLNSHKLEEQSWVSGRPVKKGWISSFYGKRTDPFTGKQSLHRGLDFAGREGADIVSVAAGVVTWAGTRSGYGNMVEVSHDDGFVSRYAHNKENLVAMGDVVRKGDTIALMGNTGRSTGVHVHFELYKHGRPVDPSSYVARTRR